MSYFGVYRAIVTNISDPQQRGRIKVICPKVLCGAESAWCEPIIPFCKDNGGDFYVPSVNEAVWLMFIEGNVDNPVYIGGWWSTSKTPLGNNYTNVDEIRIIGFKDSIILMQDNSLELIVGNSSIKVSNEKVSISGILELNGTIINPSS